MNTQHTAQAERNETVMVTVTVTVTVAVKVFSRRFCPKVIDKTLEDIRNNKSIHLKYKLKFKTINY